MKNLFLLAFLVACGNPQLVKIDRGGGFSPNDHRFVKRCLHFNYSPGEGYDDVNACIEEKVLNDDELTKEAWICDNDTISSENYFVCLRKILWRKS